MGTDSPISATLVAWGNAWLAGHVGLDEAVDRVETAGGPQTVARTAAHAAAESNAGTTAEIAPTIGADATTAVTADMTLREFLAGLRIAGLTSLRLALPVPGDPLGLVGPASLTRAALEAGQAATAVLAGPTPRRVGLVPEPDVRGSSYVGTRWTAMDSGMGDPDVPQLAEAERALADAMRSATDVLHSVGGPSPGNDRAGSGPKSGGPKSGGLRSGAPEFGGGLAPGYPGRAHRVSALAGRLGAALRLAGERGLTSGEIAARNAALRDLDRAVRRAMIAAHHAILEPGRV